MVAVAYVLSAAAIGCGLFLLWLFFDRDWPESVFFGMLSFLVAGALIVFGVGGVIATWKSRQPVTTHTNCMVISRDDSVTTTSVIVNKVIVPTTRHNYSITTSCGVFTTGSDYSGTAEGHRYTITEQTHEVISAAREPE